MVYNKYIAYWPSTKCKVNMLFCEVDISMDCTESKGYICYTRYYFSTEKFLGRFDIDEFYIYRTFYHHRNFLLRHILQKTKLFLEFWFNKTFERDHFGYSMFIMISVIRCKYVILSEIHVTFKCYLLLNVYTSL